MKTPPQQIASALNMYYEGMSLNAIRRHLDQQYGNYPSNSTIYEWIDHYTDEAVKKARQYKPEVGDVWVADETVLKIGGKNYWFWDLFLFFLDIATLLYLYSPSQASYLARSQIIRLTDITFQLSVVSGLIRLLRCD